MLSEYKLQEMLDEAAERGAKQALEKLGMHDEQAVGDVRELRDLLDSWRVAKRTIGQTILKALTTTTLAILAAGLYMHFGNK